MPRPSGWSSGEGSGKRSHVEPGVYVEDRLRELVDRARRAAGIARFSDEQVAAGAAERHWDLVPVTLLAGSVLALVLALLLG